MIDKKIGIIGCGNMGEAIFIRLSSVIDKTTRIMVSELDAKRREYLETNYKIIVEADNNYLVKYSDVIILAVKPKDFESLLKNDICCSLDNKKLVVSIAAGISTKYIESVVGKDVPVIRVMPNLPAVIGEGISSLSRGESASPEDLRLAKEIFSLIGEVVEIDEKLVDAVTAVSGSGPAYFFYLIESLVEAAQELGIDPDTASKLVLKTALGSAGLLKSSGESAASARAKVTSKGGTTEAAIKIFDSKKIKDIIKEALSAACKRAREISGG